jgi:hypothetical protein
MKPPESWAFQREACAQQPKNTATLSAWVALSVLTETTTPDW